MGYSPKFVENYTQIVEALQQDEELPIEVVPFGDTICGACPHQREEICGQEAKIHSLDTRHSDALGIAVGDVLTWREAKERLKDKMTLETFHQACEGCQWKAFGVCETALRKLRDEPS
jgi:hypothetical protein